MSIQNFVFLTSKPLPSKAVISQAILDCALPLVLPEGFDLNSQQLLRVDATFKTLPCVFDYALADYQDSDWDWSADDVDKFADKQAVAMFNCYSNAQEIMALMITSCVLAHQEGGLLYAPVFHDELIESGDAMLLLDKHYDEIQKQFNGVSQLR